MHEEEAKHRYLAKSRPLGIDAPDQLQGSPAGRGSGRGPLARGPPRFRNGGTKAASRRNAQARRLSPSRLRGERPEQASPTSSACSATRPRRRTGPHEPAKQGRRKRRHLDLMFSTPIPSRRTTRTASSMNGAMTSILLLVELRLRRNAVLRSRAPRPTPFAPEVRAKSGRESRLSSAFPKKRPAGRR